MSQTLEFAGVRPGLRWALLCATLLLTGCGGGGNDSSATGTPTLSPAPSAGNPSPGPDEPVAGTTRLSGIAAIGAALDGATVTVRGPDGAILDLGDIVTGTDGSYQVDLPADTPLPLLVVVQVPGGEPVRTLIPARSAGADSGPIVANVNPLTEVVAQELVGNPAEDAAAIGAALAPVAGDPTLVESTGNSVVTALLGGGLDYADFANDPDFAAATTDPDAVPSVTDTLLDTLADRAAGESKPLSQFLTEQRAMENPPKLIEQPAFQIQYVGQLVAKGNPPEEILTRLEAKGAITPLAEGKTSDVFRQAIVAVPVVIAETNAATGSLDGNPDLKAKAAKAAVDTLANLIDQRSKRFGDSGEELETALASDAVRSTVANVVDNVVKPVLEQVAQRTSTNDVSRAVDSVLRSTAQAAGQTLSAFSTAQITSTDVTALTSAHLRQNVVSQNVVDQLDEIEAGTAEVGSSVQSSGDVTEIATALRNLVTEDPTLVTGGDADAVLETPPGAWNQDDWNGFDWS